MKEIIFYEDDSGKSMFYNWYDKLDKSIKLKVDKRFEKIINGNFGDYKKIDVDISMT